MDTVVPKKQLRSFGLLVGGIFAVIGLWPLVFRGEDPHPWALGLTGLLVLPALLYPRVLGPVHRVWMAIGQVSFFAMTTPVDRPYGTPGLGSKYQGQRGPTPSRIHQDF